MNVWHFYQKMHTDLHSGLHYLSYFYNIPFVYEL